MELSKKLHMFLNSLGDIKNKKITVGFSGGADSTALLNLLCERQPYFKFNLEAIFFSHGTSPIAVDENKMQKFCREFCELKKIKLIIQELNLEKIPRQGWESSGRKARQKFYQQYDSNFIFLGHHKDDQNETTMTQLFRGGGKGTVAMKEIDGKYCRPLLSTLKSEIYSYLNEKNIHWIEDPTNTNTDFTRNFWRNIALPTIQKHYPNYSSILDKFRKKQDELYIISKEMAINDGLNSFLSYQNINIENISAIRLKNLLSHIFSANNKSMEDAFYEQQVNHYFSNKNIYINQKEIVIKIENNTMMNLTSINKCNNSKKTKP